MLTEKELEGVSEETAKRLQRFEDEWSGVKVKIIGTHPLSGHYGVAKRVQMVGGNIALIVKVDDIPDHECAIFNGAHLRKLP